MNAEWLERAAQAVGGYSDSQWARWKNCTTGAAKAYEMAERGIRASGLVEELAALDGERFAAEARAVAAEQALAELREPVERLLANIALTGTYNRRGYVKALNDLAEAAVGVDNSAHDDDPTKHGDPVAGEGDTRTDPYVCECEHDRHLPHTSWVGDNSYWCPGPVEVPTQAPPEAQR